MANAMIKCPNTGDAVPTGIGLSFEVFRNVQMNDNTLSGCPSCGGTHVWQGHEAFPDS